MAGIPDGLKGRSFTKIGDWSRDELALALDLADELKQERARRKELRILPGRTLALIFRKASTRTRIVIEVLPTSVTSAKQLTMSPTCTGSLKMTSRTATVTTLPAPAACAATAPA